MKTTLETRNLTPDEVLKILRHEHAILVECDEVDPVEINSDTRIREWFWYAEGEYITWAWNAKRLNRIFDLEIPRREWKTILKPSRKRILKDVCEFVAGRAKIVTIPKPNILGRPCREAGAFLAVRELMKNAGVNTDNLRPSSPISEYSSTGIPKICSSILLVAPNLMQRVRCHYPSDTMFIIMGFVLFLATLATSFLALGFQIAFLPLALICFGSFLYVWRRSVHRMEELKQVTFEGMHDFKDLCYAVVAVSPPPWKDGAPAPADGR